MIVLIVWVVVVVIHVITYVSLSFELFFSIKFFLYFLSRFNVLKAFFVFEDPSNSSAALEELLDINLRHKRFQTDNFNEKYLEPRKTNPN